MALRKINVEELRDVLRLHSLWIKGLKGGICADLHDADLRGAFLRGANLRYANLRYANLRGANLRGANLSYAYLAEANLAGADLRGVDFRLANLQSVDLRGAICDPNIQSAWCLEGSKWLRSDVPWWVGRPDQHHIIFYDQ